MKLTLLQDFIANKGMNNTYINYMFLWFGLSIALIVFIIGRIIYFYQKGNVERAERCIRIFIASLFIIVMLIITYYYMAF